MDTTPPQLDAATLAQHIEQTPALIGVGMTAPVLEGIVQHREPDRFAVLLSDPDDGARHVVEVQLGEADEDQVLRALSHWAAERHRFPAVEPRGDRRRVRSPARRSRRRPCPSHRSH